MKKFLIFALIVGGGVYYKREAILGAYHNFKLKPIRELYDKTKKTCKVIESKKKFNKAFAAAEQGILSGQLSDVEYEDLKYLVTQCALDQSITKDEVENIKKNIDIWIKGNEAIIRK